MLATRRIEREGIVKEVNRLQKKIIKLKDRIEKENEMNDLIIS